MLKFFFDELYIKFTFSQSKIERVEQNYKIVNRSTDQLCRIFFVCYQLINLIYIKKRKFFFFLKKKNLLGQ